jgi:hypothetical protein
MSSNTPTFSEVLRGAIDSSLDSLNVAIPGRVESYDAATQSCSVQPLIRKAVLDETGARVAERLPIITGVPVVFPGAGAYKIIFPIASGDIVLLVFASGSLDKWLAQGGDVDPLDDRKHSLSDAVAIPGLLSFNRASDAAHATALVFDAPLIHAGGTQELALKTDVDALAAHVNTLLVGGTGSAPNPTAPSAVGTTVLKGS